MCGIYFENKVSKIKNFSFYVKEIKNNIHNRGPDNFLHKFFAKDNLLLCNSVLSITGKKKNNSLLHHTRDKRFYISYNGEIYNYKKLALKYNLKNKTDSDTEILLKLHNLFSPLKVAKLLEGMFVYIVFEEPPPHHHRRVRSCVCGGVCVRCACAVECVSCRVVC